MSIGISVDDAYIIAIDDTNRHTFHDAYDDTFNKHSFAESIKRAISSAFTITFYITNSATIECPYKVAIVTTHGDTIHDAIHGAIISSDEVAFEYT